MKCDRELFHCVGLTKVYCKLTSLLFFRKEVDLERNLFVRIACLLVFHQGRILVMKTDVALQSENKLRKEIVPLDSGGFVSTPCKFGC